MKKFFLSLLIAGLCSISIQSHSQQRTNSEGWKFNLFTNTTFGQNSNASLMGGDMMMMSNDVSYEGKYFALPALGLGYNFGNNLAFSTELGAVSQEQMVMGMGNMMMGDDMMMDDMLSGDRNFYHALAGVDYFFDSYTNVTPYVSFDAGGAYVDSNLEGMSMMMMDDGSMMMGDMIDFSGNDYTPLFQVGTGFDYNLNRFSLGLGYDYLLLGNYDYMLDTSMMMDDMMMNDTMIEFDRSNNHKIKLGLTYHIRR